MTRPPLSSWNAALAAAVMFAAWLAAWRALSGAVGQVAAAVIGAACGAIAGALVLYRAGPSGSRDAIAGVTRAAEAMRGGDLEARAEAPDDERLAPLVRAINDVAVSRAAAIEAMHKEQELSSSILDGMLDGVIVFDRGGLIVKANLAARRLAVSGDDMIGKSAIEALRSAALAGAVDRALRRGETGAREIDIGGPLPRRLLVRTSERAGKEGSGGVVVVLHDVTDLRRLETIRTEFVANVSHELRTPVTAITSAAETLLGGALDDRRDAGEFVEIIDRNARRLRRLVEDLLDLSKIEGKAYKLAPAEEDLLPLLSHARRLVEDAAGRRRMRVVVDAAGASAWVDRHAFEQVTLNLLDNAIKYAGDGATVTVRARTEGDQVVVSVADTGVGIAPQHLDRLFERFYRVDTGRSREMGGTGLGLAIVKHLVESMGGTIAVESELGRGTVFTIYLSRTAPSPREEMADSEDSARSAPAGAAVAAAPDA